MRDALGTSKEDYAPTLGVDWRAGWPALAELGLPALCVPEARGGFGFRADAAAAVAEELGAALHASPFAALSASAHALANSDNPVAGELLAEVLTGERTCAFGELIPGRHVARQIQAAPEADALLLLEAPTGHGLLFNDASQWSVDTGLPPFDVSRTSGDVSVDRRLAEQLPFADQALPLYRLLLVADALGGLRRMLSRTVTYAATRQSFGKPIGALQAVQHRLVDHSVRERGMSLVVADAARALTAGSPEASRLVTLAELSVSSCTTILHDLVQLTGAIGFTWEYGLHLYERRAHQNARLGGNPRAAARRLASLEGWDR